MELSLIKRYFVKSSTTSVSRLARASIHGNAQSDKNNGNKYNVGATFPDDFEDSPLKSEILQKPNSNPGIEDSYHPTMDEIYESVRGKVPPKNTKTKPTVKEEKDEREPTLDEM